MRAEDRGVPTRTYAELERDIGNRSHRRDERAQVDHAQSVPLREQIRIREQPEIRGSQRRVIAERQLVVRAPQPGAGFSLWQLVVVEIEALDLVASGLRTRDHGELKRLSGVGPVAAAAAALRRTV
jgi:hypothetical protein